MRRFNYILFLSFPACLLAQSQEVLESAANTFFQNKEFNKSLEAYARLNNLHPNDAPTLAKLGICYFETGLVGQAMDCLRQATNAGAKAPPEAFLYLGKCHHANLEFEAAADLYKDFLRNTDQKHPLRAAVKADILRCAVGLRAKRQAAKASAYNLGPPVNSAFDEKNPLPSRNYSDLLYFASNRPGLRTTAPASFDMYRAQQEMDSWQEPAPLGLTINSAQEELPLAFSDNGARLYFFRGNTTYSGDILVDTFSENIADKDFLFQELVSPVRAWEGDCDVQFFNDSTLLFASRRLGGYGGLDIYVARRTPNGWTTPKNLGPDINAAFDERSPHLAPDGRTLYFSTNDARRSMGGLDVMQATFLDWAGKWTPPVNLGAPINSAADDEHFTLLGDGWSALFSSSRKSGEGGSDIYKAQFKESIGKQLYLSDPSVFFLVKNNEETPVNRRPLHSAVFFDRQPLPFDNPFMPLPDAMFPRLEYLAEWLKAYPALQLTLVVHSSPNDNGLFPSRPVSQQLNDFFKEAALPPNQIRFMHVGTNFPMAKGNSRRVEIYVADPAVLPVTAMENVKSQQSFQSQYFSKAMSGLAYQVLVPVDDNEALTKLLALYPKGILLEYPTESKAFFSTGIQLTWLAAVEAEKDILRWGFQGSATPFLHGWELDRARAEWHLFEYPELRGFVDRE